jgi:hypothetical protein
VLLYSLPPDGFLRWSQPQPPERTGEILSSSSTERMHTAELPLTWNPYPGLYPKEKLNVLFLETEFGGLVVTISHPVLTEKLYMWYVVQVP